VSQEKRFLSLQRGSAELVPQTPVKFRRRHPARSIKVTMVFGLLAVLAVACGTRTVPCGTFGFTGPRDPDLTATVDFDFDATRCGRCRCNQICYVLITRVVDQTTGRSIRPLGEQGDRTVGGLPDNRLNGWAVDRPEGAVWGHYGRIDFLTFDGALTTTGNNTAPARLRHPLSLRPNTLIDAVAVPVCIDERSGCRNRILGYYYWLITVDRTGTVSSSFDEIGVTWMREAFDNSITQWNKFASGLGKNSFSAMSPL
jgi:hypothetical protein